MPVIILIPAFICTLALCFWSPARVFRDVVLPVLLLLPIYYYWKVALLPPFDFADAVLIPLGAAMFFRCMRRWHYSLMDLWLVLFILSTCVSDRLLGANTASVFELVYSLSKILVPYMAGKLLIEQDGARPLTLQRIVLYIFAASILSMYERIAAINPFRSAFTRFFPDNDVVWTTQFRGGAARLSGPYAQAELAGMMLLFGILFALYLGHDCHWGQRFRNMPTIPIRKSWIAAGVIALALYFTQSRGPQLGFLCAVPIAFIGRSRHVLRASLIVLALLVVGGGVAYEAVVHYAVTNAPTSEQQETAAYRAQLLKDYLPIAEHSGAWGMGPHFPRIGKYVSVDNEYLFVALTQGYIGLGTLLLLIAGTLYNLVTAALYNPQSLDRSFAFTLLGIFVGILITIATVYLGNQPLIFFFLLVGWSQSLRAHRVPKPHPVFQQVYT